MKGSRRRNRPIHPFIRLAVAMGVAARDIHSESGRKEAVRQAETIPVSNLERGGGKKGELARMGRKTMLGLLALPPEAYADAASVLRGCRDACSSRFEETSFVKFNGRRRPPAHPAL